MQAIFPDSPLPPLEKLIDYAPPTVVRETTVWDAITFMNQYQPPAQWVLVVENGQVIGFFSWEDVLQVVESEINLRSSKITEVMNTSAIKLKYSHLKDIKLILDTLRKLKNIPIIIEDEKEQLVGYIAPQFLIAFFLKDYQSKITNYEFYCHINNANNTDFLCSKESSKVAESEELEENCKQALEKEKEINELKSRFISMTSHEFRTPLSTILSSSELLETYRHKWDDEKQLKHLNRIKKAVDHMTSLLNDVLFFSKAEVGKIEYNPVNLDLIEYSRQIVEDFHINQIKNSPGQQLNVNIHFITNNAKIIGYMDERTVGHILNNLLSNAIKYSNSGNTVNFILSSQKGRAIFEIQDEGIGIPPEDLPSLFDSFHRCKNVSHIPGTGLGLSIVKKCVEMLQGEISVISEVGVGTKFIVEIPLANCCNNS